jgi:hypothetical protein
LNGHLVARFFHQRIRFDQLGGHRQIQFKHIARTPLLANFRVVARFDVGMR